MRTKLRKIYLKNYKLFLEKELSFQDIALSVFDGPNGYGKTSVFDSIELLVTGTLKRVEQTDVVNGSTAYSTRFFANKENQPVWIMGEFEDSNASTFVIAMCFAEHKPGKENNPKTVIQKAKQYIISQTTIAANKDSILAGKVKETSKNAADAFRKEYFGTINIDRYEILHYISQEDRLSFFNNSEAKRQEVIEKLLGIEKTAEKLKKITTAKKDIDKKYKALNKSIKDKKDILAKRKSGRGESVVYKRLFTLQEKTIWDQREVFSPGRDNDSLLKQYFNEIDSIKQYIHFRKLHQISYAMKQYEKIPEHLIVPTIRLWHANRSNQLYFGTLEQERYKKSFLEEQTGLYKDDKYLELNCEKLCTYVCDEETKSEILRVKNELNQFSATQNKLEKAITGLNDARESLQNRYHVAKKESDDIHLSVCPYCGYDWKDAKILETQYQDTKTLLEELSGSSQVLFDETLERFKNKINEKVIPKVTEHLQKLEQNYALVNYMKFANKAEAEDEINHIKAGMNLVVQKLDTQKYNVLYGVELSDKGVDVVLSTLQEIYNSVTAEYREADRTYNFTSIKAKYFYYENDDHKLSEKDLEDKKDYIQEQFYKIFDSIETDINTMTNQLNELGIIKKQMDIYQKELTQAKNSFITEMVNEMGMSFYLYTMRLLQSYQGGEGVYIKSSNGGIRFSASRSEHDVTYTMSSGQLSAVLLAFSLVMNKIYCSDGFSTLLIDDPIQCMDDINMISFVDLLRNEFSEDQIILSTHEEDFSNYITYKFGKSGLDTNQISLQEM